MVSICIIYHSSIICHAWICHVIITSFYIY
nr:MAG TPA: hypothetical protein [Caudoviricetes sp.]